MLERYFVRPTTIDRIRSSWLGEPIERYVTWLTEHHYSPRNVLRRVPILVHFGDFAAARGATRRGQLVSIIIKQSTPTNYHVILIHKYLDSKCRIIY